MPSKIKLLDGGLSCDLFLSGNVDKDKMNTDPLWVGRVLLEDPEEIKKSHIRFILAGCDVITTGSYQCSVEGFVKHGNISEVEAKELIGSTVDIAEDAIKEAGVDRPIEVAASISPYGATLHDMSEYSGSYIDKMSEAQLIEFHSTNVNIFLSKGVKLFAIETCPALKEALAVLKVLEAEPQARAWVSFTTTDGLTTSYGDKFEDVYQVLSKNKQVFAIGANCSNAELVLKQALLVKDYLGSHQSFVAYPNLFQTLSDSGYYDNNCSPSYTELVWQSVIKSWLDTGIFGMIGGCCMVEPKHLVLVKQELDKWQSS